MAKQEEIRKIFDTFNKMKVLIIGDVMVDSYLWGNVNRISPEAPVPIVAVKKRESRLGGAGNVAINIQALGAEPILCSVIGNDIKSNEFRELLDVQNLTSKGIIKSSSRLTTTKFRIMGNKTQMLRVDEETDRPLNDEDSEKLYNTIEKILTDDKISVIIFEDYDKGIISPELIQRVVSKANKLNIPVTADPKRKNFTEYKNISLLKPNLKELSEGMKSDLNADNAAELINAVNQLHDRQNIEIILTTLSEKGVLISTKDRFSKIIPAHIRNISDVSGAGDTVISVASLCLALKMPPAEIASISNIAGGMVCEKVGVIPVDKNRLLEEALKFL